MTGSAVITIKIKICMMISKTTGQFFDATLTQRDPLSNYNNNVFYIINVSQSCNIHC